jgi:anthranilate synthase component 2
MAPLWRMQHKTRPVYGVQFHPESIATQKGHGLIGQFPQIGTARN